VWTCTTCYYLLQLVFSACAAAVKGRPVLHHCVVIFFWSSGSMECTCMLFTFENGVLLMRYGASLVWHHSLLLMNSFNKTEAAVFSCRLCFLRTFPFISLNVRLVLVLISHLYSCVLGWPGEPNVWIWHDQQTRRFQTSYKK